MVITNDHAICIIAVKLKNLFFFSNNNVYLGAPIVIISRYHHNARGHAIYDQVIEILRTRNTHLTSKN